MPDAKKYIPERGMRDHLGGKVRMIWDFEVNGGAIGTVNLDVMLPQGAIVKGGFVHVLEAVTSGGVGTLSFGMNTAADLLPATAVGSLTQDAVIELSSDATPLLLTGDRELKAAVATAALTGGKVAIYIEYVGSSIDVEPVIYRKV